MFSRLESMIRRKKSTLSLEQYDSYDKDERAVYNDALMELFQHPGMRFVTDLSVGYLNTKSTQSMSRSPYLNNLSLMFHFQQIEKKGT
ncbi:MAG: hypothetical protein AAGJ35_07910 [Myxococcota bacterium]